MSRFTNRFMLARTWSQYRIYVGKRKDSPHEPFAAPLAEVVAKSKHEENIGDGADDEQNLDDPAPLIDVNGDGDALQRYSTSDDRPACPNRGEEETEGREVPRVAELVQSVREPALVNMRTGFPSFRVAGNLPARVVL
jgi:hypothetical protein